MLDHQHSARARFIVALSVAMFSSECVHGQGALTPPGAPAPTMKTLSQVEPRTLISALPFSASIPGSYYLATNLIATFGSGITISTNNVSIDLNGFAIMGSGASGNGIVVSGNCTNLWIGNGALSHLAGNGVYAATAYNSRFEGLRISNIGNTGLAVGESSTVVNCSAQACILGGFYSISPNIVYQSCTARTNGQDGFAAGAKATVANCVSIGNAFNGITTGDSATVQNCNSGNNGSNGVAVGQSSSVQDCTINENGLQGVYLVSSYNRVTRCNIIGNLRNGIYGFNGGQSVVGCMINNNRNHGIFLNSCCNIITDCALVENYYDGISAGDGGQITGNLARYNGRGTNGAGIRLPSSGNRVENNTMGGNTVGILALSSGNLIIKNYAQQNITNYHILGTQKIGPIITTSGTITNENAWANFSDM